MNVFMNISSNSTVAEDERNGPLKRSRNKQKKKKRKTREARQTNESKLVISYSKRRASFSARAVLLEVAKA